jgi:translation elongation factor EF-4
MGYIISGIKEAKDVKVGDTITRIDNLAMALLKALKM